MTPTPPKKLGRPSKYKPEFAEMLFSHMCEGLSFEAFGGKPEVRASVSMLYTWAEAHGEFREAKMLGLTASRLFWEQMGRAGAAGKLPGFVTAAWIFNMKNRFQWRDRQDLEVNGGIQIDVRQLPEETILREIDELEAKRKAQLRVVG